MSDTVHWLISDQLIRISLTLDPTIPLNIREKWRSLLFRYSANVSELSLSREPDICLHITCPASWAPNEQEPSLDFVYSSDNRIEEVTMNRLDLRGRVVRRGNHFQGIFAVDPNSALLLVVVVRSLMTLVCEERGELMLHASAVYRQGRMWVFFGPSGAGKSTIAGHLNGGGTPHASDRVILKIEDGVVVVYATPFSDHEQVIIGRPPPQPLFGLAYIRQAAKCALAPLSVAEATRLIFSESSIYSKRPFVFEKAMDVVAAVVESNKCVTLDFEKSQSFWQLLDEM